MTLKDRITRDTCEHIKVGVYKDVYYSVEEKLTKPSWFIKEKMRNLDRPNSITTQEHIRLHMSHEISKYDFKR
jgi:hypothetical protein